MTNSYTFSVDKSLLRLDQYLSMKLPDISRSKIQHHIKMWQVKIDGKLVKSSFMLKVNEVIDCCFNDKDIDISFQPEEIDLDILTYNYEYIDLHYLKIPHPKIFERAFVLVPWNDIYPNYKLKSINKTVGHLLSNLKIRDNTIKL